jgi:hypothetical protein
MSRKHSHRPPNRAPSTAPGGDFLARLPRDEGEELRLTVESYKGKPYLALWVWRRGPTGAWAPFNGWGKGVTIRLREIQGIAKALRTVRLPSRESLLAREAQGTSLRGSFELPSCDPGAPTDPKLVAPWEDLPEPAEYSTQAQGEGNQSRVSDFVEVT